MTSVVCRFHGSSVVCASSALRGLWSSSTPSARFLQPSTLWVATTPFRRSYSSFNTSMASPLAESFRKADTNVDGRIDVKEFTCLVAESGLLWDNPGVQAMFASLDKNKNGFIEPEEWESLIGPMGWQKLTQLRKVMIGEPQAHIEPTAPPEHSKLAQAFVSSDMNKDGVMDIKEFTVLVMKSGLSWNDERVQSTFDRVDKDGNGTIERDEWEKLLGPPGWKALTDLRNRMTDWSFIIG